jgi:hypothetical protein
MRTRLSVPAASRSRTYLPGAVFLVAYSAGIACGKNRGGAFCRTHRGAPRYPPVVSETVVLTRFADSSDYPGTVLTGERLEVSMKIRVGLLTVTLFAVL